MTEKERSAAATEMFRWLNNPSSKLRGLLTLESSGGCIYAANVMERVARAFVKNENVTAADFIEMANARASKSEDKREEVRKNDTAGLFV